MQDGRASTPRIDVDAPASSSRRRRASLDGPRTGARVDVLLAPRLRGLCSTSPAIGLAVTTLLPVAVAPDTALPLGSFWGFGRARRPRCVTATLREDLRRPSSRSPCGGLMLRPGCRRPLSGRRLCELSARPSPILRRQSRTRTADTSGPQRTSAVHARRARPSGGGQRRQACWTASGRLQPHVRSTNVRRVWPPERRGLRGTTPGRPLVGLRTPRGARRWPKSSGTCRFQPWIVRLRDGAPFDRL